MSERVTLHVFEQDGTNHQVGECAVSDQETISAYLIENVTKFHELRIVDAMDNTLFHVVDQVLLFPIPEGGTINNKWNPESRRFVETVIGNVFAMQETPLVEEVGKEEKP